MSDIDEPFPNEITDPAQTAECKQCLGTGRVTPQFCRGTVACPACNGQGHKQEGYWFPHGMFPKTPALEKHREWVEVDGGSWGYSGQKVWVTFTENGLEMRLIPPWEAESKAALHVAGIEVQPGPVVSVTGVKPESDEK